MILTTYNKEIALRIIILVLITYGFLFEAKANSDKRLYIVGSSSVENMIDGAAQQFAINTGLQVIKRSVKFGDAVDDVGTNTSQLAIISRPLTAIEQRRYPQIVQTKVAYDAIVFFTHKTLPETSIRQQDIISFYTQKNPQWPSAEEDVFAMSKNIEHGIHQAFTETFGLESSRVPSQLGIRFKVKSNDSKYNDASISTFGRVSQAARKIARKRNSIAYDSLGAYQDFIQTLSMPKTKLLAIEGVHPVESSKANPAYPIKRALYIIYDKNSNLGEQQFVEFLLSEPGRQIIEKNYYYPL